MNIGQSCCPDPRVCTVAKIVTSFIAEEPVKVGNDVGLVQRAALLRHSLPVLVDGRGRAGTNLGDLFVVLSGEVKSEDLHLLRAERALESVGRHEAGERRAVSIVGRWR